MRKKRTYVKAVSATACYFFVSQTLQASQANAITSKVLRLAAPDNWCPVACSANSKKEGTYIDIARAIWPDWRLSYSNASYARIIINAKKGLVDAIPAVIPNEAPGFLFPSTPGSVVQWCFYKKPGADWRFTGVDSLKGHQIGITQGYSYPSEIEAVRNTEEGNASFLTLAGREVPRRLSKMVLANRLTAMVEGKEAMEWQMSEKFLPRLANAGCIKERVPAFLAFSPSFVKAKEMAKEFSEGMRRLRASGQLRQILLRYGLTDFEAKL